jgi:hypothetical protein
MALRRKARGDAGCAVEHPAGADGFFVGGDLVEPAGQEPNRTGGDAPPLDGQPSRASSKDASTSVERTSRKVKGEIGSGGKSLTLALRQAPMDSRS